MPKPMALLATSWPILPKPIIPSVLFWSSLPAEYDFFRLLKFVSPSIGILLLALYKNLTILNRCANTSSATEDEDAAGVLITLLPFSLA